MVYQRFVRDERGFEDWFDVGATVHYRVFGQASKAVAGIGQTLSISRSGLRLRVQHALQLCDRLAVTVDLMEPAELGRAELTLIGVVVQVEPDSVVLQFDPAKPEQRPASIF